MTITTLSSVAPIKALMDQIDERIEAALNAQDFSFSALSADPSGAELCFESSGPAPNWRIAFRLPPASPAELCLRLNGEARSAVELTLRIDGRVVDNLATALAIAMTLLDSLREA